MAVTPSSPLTRQGMATGPLIVTGTDTGVGKTIATAAIAAAATGSGVRVAVLKPGQTGLAPDELSDVDVVVDLAGPAYAETLATYPHPLAPSTAARVADLPLLPLSAVQEAIRRASSEYDLVLVEGAGGLLVPMGESGWTIADLASSLALPVLVVARAGLGTLNHTALTLEACARRDIEATVAIGAWPAEPELVHQTNLTDLPGELVAVLPEGAGMLAPAAFRTSAPTWLTPSLYGTFDPVEFRDSIIGRPPSCS